MASEAGVQRRSRGGRGRMRWRMEAEMRRKDGEGNAGRQ
jgi:hypothetical protein